MNIVFSRKTLFLLVAAAVGLLLPATAHAKCDGEPDPGSATWGHVCGRVKKLGHNGISFYTKEAGPSYVKICPAGGGPNHGCSTVSTSTYQSTDGSTHQTFIFRYFRLGKTAYESFDLYAWGSYGGDYWGSETTPLRRLSIGPGMYAIGLNMPPRPLPPNPVYPSGIDVPGSYTVTWESGLGSGHDRTAYPVSYEVWFKYWPFGGTEPANWSISAAHLACHDDGSGPDWNNQCSTEVAGPQPPGNWKWYVVANLNVSAALAGFPPGTLFITSTNSPWASFTQPY